MRAWIAVLALLIGGLVFGDEIYFKDGTSVHCKIVKETPGRVVYTVKGVRHEVARATIEKIERTKELEVDARGGEKEGGTKVEPVCKGDKGEGEKGEDSCVPNPDNYKNGYAQGLAAHYYVDPTNWDGHWMEGTNPTVDPKEWTFTNYSYTSVEPHINHQFIRKGWFSVRWQGKLIVGTPASADNGKDKKEMVDVEFEMWADDGCRLIIDGETLIDSWIPCWEKSPESHRVAKAKLLTGKHDIVIEYFQGESLKHDDKDPIKLYWKCEALNIPAQVIPASHFEHSKLDLVPRKGRLDKDDVLPNFKRGMTESKK
jgi:hypothetical protein